MMLNGMSRHEVWTGRRQFRTRAHYWARRVGVKPKRIGIQSMNSKWASCSTKGYVTFSSQLLDMDREFGEYVIVHELLHMTIPNHSKLFKSLMGIHMPDWKARVAKMNEEALARVQADA